MPSTYNRSDTVTCLTRKGPLDCVVAHARRISRGRNAGEIEYTLAPLGTAAGQSFLTVRGTRFLSPCSKRYSAAQIKAALAGQVQVADQRATAQQQRADRGRQQIGQLMFTGHTVDGSKIAVGDRVLVRGHRCPNWIGTVGKLNFKTGKIGLVRSHANASAANDLDLIAQLLGKPARRQQYRWIHPDCVIRVVHPEAPVPFKLRASDRKALAADGYVQRTFGQDVVERSYVVAASPTEARLEGRNYDGASSTVHHDPALDLYWRSTGSFD